MTDIFMSTEVVKLLKDKTVVFMGGSVNRGMYKDLVWMINSNSLLPFRALKIKGEANFPDLHDYSETSETIRNIFSKDNVDVLHDCGECDEDFKGIVHGRNYKETRSYFSEEHNISVHYRFISKVWTKETREWLSGFEDRTGRKIDFLFVSSSIWDVNRWGPLFEDSYKTGLANLVSNLPSDCCFFWMTTPQVSSELISRGMESTGLEFTNLTSKFNVLEANICAANYMKSINRNVLDLNFALQGQTARRNADGLHWSPEINRLMTNKILTHLALAQGEPLPGRLKSKALARLQTLDLNRNTLLDKLTLTADKLTLTHEANQNFSVKVNNRISQHEENVASRSRKEELFNRMSKRVSKKLRHKATHPYRRKRLDHSENYNNSNNYFDGGNIDENLPVGNDNIPGFHDYNHRNNSQMMFGSGKSFLSNTPTGDIFASPCINPMFSSKFRNFDEPAFTIGHFNIDESSATFNGGFYENSHFGGGPIKRGRYRPY